MRMITEAFSETLHVLFLSPGRVVRSVGHDEIEFLFLVSVLDLEIRLILDDLPTLEIPDNRDTFIHDSWSSNCCNLEL